MEILDQGADALVENRKVFGFPLKDGIVRPAVPVPLAVVKCDDAGAGLDQSPGHQQALRHARGAVLVHEDVRVAGPVTIHNSRIFLGEIKSLRQAGRGEQSERLLIEVVHAVHHADGVEVAAQVVETFKQGLAVGEPLHRHAVRRHVVARARRGGMGRMTARRSRSPVRCTAGAYRCSTG